jgi:hypothetical protein
MQDWQNLEGWAPLPLLQKQREQRQTNDHGILYLCGDVRDGEWMHTEGELPPVLQNRC